MIVKNQIYQCSMFPLTLSISWHATYWCSDCVLILMIHPTWLGISTTKKCDVRSRARHLLGWYQYLFSHFLKKTILINCFGEFFIFYYCLCYIYGKYNVKIYKKQKTIKNNNNKKQKTTSNNTTQKQENVKNWRWRLRHFSWNCVMVPIFYFSLCGENY